MSKKNGKSAAAGTRGSRKARGKSEAMTGVKEGAVEVRKIGKGDNERLALPDPSDFDHHYKTIKGMKERAATASANLRHAKTAANKATPGLAATVEEIIAIERENDPAKLQRRLEMLGLGLKQTNSTIQLTIFDSLAGDVKAQAYRKGKTDAERGDFAENPYPEGSDLAAEYSRGWEEITAARLGVGEGAGKSTEATAH